MRGIVLICSIVVVVGLTRLLLGRYNESKTVRERQSKPATTSVSVAVEEVREKQSEAATVFEEANDTKPIKYGSRGEKVACEYMSRRFGMRFESHRPSFLRNPKTGRNLELDCWNESSKVAVEYNGKQHYVFIRHFFKNLAQFEEQEYRDRLKMELCNKNGIKLIVVPYTMSSDADIENYIESQLVDM